MNRKDFLQLITAAGTATASGIGLTGRVLKGDRNKGNTEKDREHKADVVIAGGGLFAFYDSE